MHVAKVISSIFYTTYTCDVVMEHSSHWLLESRRGITISLLHHLTHKGAEYHREGGFRHVFRFNVYLFIHLWHVQFGPVRGTSDIMPNCVMVWKAQYVLLCIVVLHREVEHCIQLATLLQHTEHRHCLLGCGGDPPTTGWSFLQAQLLAHQAFGQLVSDLLPGSMRLILWLASQKGGSLGGTPLTRSVILSIHCSLNWGSSWGSEPSPCNVANAMWLMLHCHCVDWGQCGPLHTPALSLGVNEVYFTHLPGFIPAALSVALAARLGSAAWCLLVSQTQWEVLGDFCCPHVYSPWACEVQGYT